MRGALTAPPPLPQRQALLAAEEEEEAPAPDARAGLRANMGTILEDLDESDPNFQRVAKYMQVAARAPAPGVTRSGGRAAARARARMLPAHHAPRARHDRMTPCRSPTNARHTRERRARARAHVGPPRARQHAGGRPRPCPPAEAPAPSRGHRHARTRT